MITNITQIGNTNEWSFEQDGVEGTIFMPENATAADVEVALTPLTEEQVAELEAMFAKNDQIADAKKLLADTDWVVVKIQEAALLGGDTTALLAQYQDVLDARVEARATINSLES
jgi:hypothetical protein